MSLVCLITVSNEILSLWSYGAILKSNIVVLSYSSLVGFVFDIIPIGIYNPLELVMNIFGIYKPDVVFITILFDFSIYERYLLTGDAILYLGIDCRKGKAFPLLLREYLPSGRPFSSTLKKSYNESIRISKV